LFTFTIACGREWSDVTAQDIATDTAKARRARMAVTRNFDRANAGRSAFVGFMRIALPTLAIVLLATVLIWPQVGQDERSFALSFSDRASAGDALSMVNARYYGSDKNGRPYMLTAAVATQDPADTKVVILDKMTADVTMGNGTWIWMNAATGAFQQDDQVLLLHGGASLYTSIGYEFHGQIAEINLRDSSMKSDHPVHGQGPLGRLRSDTALITERGNLMEFVGRVHVTIHPRNKPAV
jgi:lipopolysaccharide export system protein LptC